MEAAADAEFREFVIARRQRFLRTAYLLTGDETRAEQLVEKALVHTRRRWRRAIRDDDPETHTLRALVSMQAAPWRERRMRAARVIDRAIGPYGDAVGSGDADGAANTDADAGDSADVGASADVDDAADPHGGADAGAAVDGAGSSEGESVPDAIWEVLGTLRPRTRAVLVLRHYEDLLAEDTADLLGCSAGTVRDEESRGLRLLREATRSPQNQPVQETYEGPGAVHSTSTGGHERGGGEMARAAESDDGRPPRRAGAGE